MGKLSGKVALITGAARGLGRAYAIRLAQLGADVGIIDIDLKSHLDVEKEAIGSEFTTVIDELRSMGTNAYGVEADVSDELQIGNAVDEIAAKLGDIDVLVANAGGGSGSLHENTAALVNSEELKKVMERNFYGTVYTVKAVQGNMKKRGTGKIVTVTSLYGILASKEGSYAHYSASKSAIISYTKNLAQELGPFNIQVNAIAPGYIGTGRLLDFFEKDGLEKYTDQTALKRLGTPDDCANVIEFLTTNMSDYVTGTVIDVSGGSIR